MFDGAVGNLRIVPNPLKLRNRVVCDGGESNVSEMRLEDAQALPIPF